MLSLLAEKIPDLYPISKSINFLLSNYADTPSNINGKIDIKKQFVSSDNISISNNSAESVIKGKYNFLEDILDGKIYFFENNITVLEASLEGNINDPQILIEGKYLFKNYQNNIPQDIKKLITNGINSFIEKMLIKNE